MHSDTTPDPPTPDPIDVLRCAVWGSTDEATTAVAALSGEDAELAREIRRVRSLRDAVREVRDEPPPEVVRRVRAQVEALSIDPREAEWLIAVPLVPAAGVRGTRTGAAPASSDAAAPVPEEPRDPQRICDTGKLVVDAVLQRGAGRDEFAVTGQVLLPGGDPAVGALVTLFVGYVGAATTRTDEFGEFTFAPRSGPRLGVRVVHADVVRFVQLWSQEEEGAQSQGDGGDIE